MQNSPFLPQRWQGPLSVLIAPSHRGMARLSGLDEYRDSIPAKDHQSRSDPWFDVYRLALMMWPTPLRLYSETMHAATTPPLTHRHVAAQITVHTPLHGLSQHTGRDLYQLGDWKVARERFLKVFRNAIDQIIANIGGFVACDILTETFQIQFSGRTRQNWTGYREGGRRARQGESGGERTGWGKEKEKNWRGERMSWIYLLNTFIRPESRTYNWLNHLRNREKK